LDAGDGNNTVGNLLGDPPLFSNYYNWNGSSFDIATYLGGGEWDPAAAADWPLAPGGGGFINLGEAYSVTFVGEAFFVNAAAAATWSRVFSVN
jgi:hypothetical protein